LQLGYIRDYRPKYGCVIGFFELFTSVLSNLFNTEGHITD